MRPIVKRVKGYWKRRLPWLRFDTDTLSDCIEALTMEERATLSLWDGMDSPTNEVAFLLSKVLNRHNDVCSGATAIVNDKGKYVVEFTSRSSISELKIQYKTLTDCNKACVYHIEDISKEILLTLSFEAIADVTGAILEADRVSADDEQGHCVVETKCDCNGECPVCMCTAKE